MAIVEIGTAPSRTLKDHNSSFGPTVAVEVSPIENWLELEAGVTPSFGRRTTEWATDLLFKKPWTLSRTAEFMAGIGPEWIHTRESGTTTNSVAGEAVLDFMFWPGRWRHKIGWYVEPGYEYSFGRGHERSNWRKLRPPDRDSQTLAPVGRWWIPRIERRLVASNRVILQYSERILERE